MSSDHQCMCAAIRNIAIFFKATIILIIIIIIIITFIQF